MVMPTSGCAARWRRSGSIGTTRRRRRSSERRRWRRARRCSQAPTRSKRSMPQAAAFDRMAADYDRSFTASAIGRRMRAAVWRRLDATFRPGERVLELNCGTGEDAVHLARRGVRVVATDISSAMLAKARSKVERAGVAESVELVQLRIEDLSNRPIPGSFDGVLSNFGGLNCVDNLSGAGRALAAMLRPGARALLCVMGPAVPWEW